MLYENLYQLTLRSEWEQLSRCFSSMSNTEFRRAEVYIRKSLLPTLSNDAFWNALYHLVQYRRQAFLSGVLSAEKYVKDGTLDLCCQGARLLSVYLYEIHPLSVSKIVGMLLPLLQNSQQIEDLFRTFRIDDERQRVMALLRVESPHAYYLLFNALRHIPDNRVLALNCCRYIMGRKNDMAYNMAALLQAYFGLDELRGQFSLNVQPYELSLLDRGPKTFYQILNGRRPQL